MCYTILVNTELFEMRDYLKLLNEFRSLGCTNEALCSAACQVFMDLHEVDCVEDLRYHYNAKHDIIFLTAVSSPNQSRERGALTNDRPSDEEDETGNNLPEDYDMPSTSTASAAPKLPVNVDSNHEMASSSSETSEVRPPQDIDLPDDVEDDSLNWQNCEDNQVQTKFYLPHLGCNNINLPRLNEIQDSLFEWAQHRSEYPPAYKHVVLAIVDPSSTIVYYQMTQSCSSDQ